MKIAVLGGTGLIGSKLVTKLREHDHEVVAAGVNTGVNTVTGEGVAETVDGADVVVDVTNSPSFDEGPATQFFTTSTRNLLEASAAAGAGHYVALSVVGTDRLAADSGYFRAKLAQERLIQDAGRPYTLVHATQFFEFVKTIAAVATNGNTVSVAPILIQPIASDDVASCVGRIAVGEPANGIVEIAGPNQFRLDDLIRRRLSAANDPREVRADPSAGYFGFQTEERALIPGDAARIGQIRFEDWLRVPVNAV